MAATVTAEAGRRLRLPAAAEPAPAALRLGSAGLRRQLTALPAPGRRAGAHRPVLGDRTRAQVLTRPLRQTRVGDQTGWLLSWERIGHRRHVMKDTSVRQL